MKKYKLVLTTIIFVLINIIPIIIAYQYWGGEYIFSGFLYNPLDGNTYFAKMYQGWLGSWKFVLPYSSNSGEPTCLFLFYITLGHLSRILHLSIPLTFHLFRILFSTLMCLSLIKLLNEVLDYDQESIYFAYLFALFGSGLGWIFVFLNRFTPDFWLAEAYPFLSSYANPHFPLGIALYLYIIKVFIATDIKTKNIFTLFFSGLLLSIIIPFALVSVLGVILVFQIYDYIANRKIRLRYLISLVSGGMPYSIYQLLVISNHPQLSIWNSQNITPSPPLIEIIIALSPMIVFAMIMILRLRDNRNNKLVYMFLWCTTCMCMMYLPHDLQRRLAISLSIPIAILAASCFNTVFGNKYNYLKWLLFLFSLPTIIIVLSTSFYAIKSHDHTVFLTRYENDAIHWLRDHSKDPKDVVLAEPDLSLFIPSNTGLKVVYGHPFETINATEMKNLVENILSGKTNIEEKVVEKKIPRLNYVIINSNEVDKDIFGSEDYQLLHSSGPINVILYEQ